MSGPSTDGAARPACSNAIVWCLWPTNPQNKSSGGFRTQSIALTSAHNFISRRHDDLECSWGFRPDLSIQARLWLLIRPNSISCVDIHILLRNTYRVFQHSVKPVRPKNDSADSTGSPVAVYFCSRNTCP